ncbi:hypothetical protein [Bacteroides sp. HPS0048]|uniref:hypothetical protein n=1 Tax=Bacteroides sp. HPS0048 TaxID=1078089 RepID=UPI003564F3B7
MRSLWKADAEEADDEPEEKTEEPYTVIGKSTYRNRQIYEPDDNRRHADNQDDKTDNFAAGTPGNNAKGAADGAEKQPETATGEPVADGAEQPEETDTADDEEDYSDIEVEPEEDEADEEEYVPTPEEVEEEEGLGAYYPDGNPDFATGYTFEDLKKVHRIMVADDANEQEKQQAREVLPAVMGSDVWDEMLDEFEGARQRVARLMNNNNV